MTGMDVLGLNLSNPGLSQQKVSHAHPYASYISSSASSSSSSIFSLDSVSSQGSISSTSTNPADVIWENESASLPNGRALPHSGESNPRCLRNLVNGVVPKSTDTAVPPELRKHPRRTSSYVQSNGVPVLRAPPCLLRQSERKVNFVDNLVDSASQIVEIIWPLSGRSHRSDSVAGARGVLPLRTFIQETLRRSRTSYSTLQVALYYLIKVKSHVSKYDFSKDQARDKPQLRAMQCGRRMFLAALILASKYLQDRNYSARAWSKISGLNTLEINQNELMFLDAVQWRLHIPEATYHRWTDIVLKLTAGAGGSPPTEGLCWRMVVPNLTPELENVELELGCATPPTPSFSGFDLDSLSPRSPPASELPSLSSYAGEPPAACSRNIPKTLEPTPRMDYPSSSFPPVPRPSLLPTPQMAPQSSMASTPAVSAGPFRPRRPTAICLAMNQVQNVCMARSTLDQRPQATFCPKASNIDGHPALVRRSSLARSNSSMSSPDSMVSDASTVSSQSSQSSQSSSSSSSSSSLSSGAPGFCAMASSRLGNQTTHRCAKPSFMDYQWKAAASSPVDATSFRSENYSSPDSYTGPIGQVPDLSNISLETPGDLNASTQEAARSLCELSGAVSLAQEKSETVGDPNRCRKRVRTGSEDLSLQNDVRHMINSMGHGSVLEDENLASSFLFSEQKPNRTKTAPHLIGPGGIPRLVGPPPMPLSGPAGVKRACCGSETRQVALNPSVRTEYMG